MDLSYGLSKLQMVSFLSCSPLLVTNSAVPLKFHEVPGMFAGEFISMKTDVISENQTKISWNLYGCHSGGMHREPPPSLSPAQCHFPFEKYPANAFVIKGYSEFQRMVLTRVNGLLEKDGKVKGESKAAWSEIGAPRDMTLASAINIPSTTGSQHPLTNTGMSKMQHLGNAWTVL